MHGYPPDQLAGTEIYAARVTAGMAARGWRVHVLAATRAPGRPQGSERTGPLPGGGALIRRVNNLPWRPLGAAERDPALERRVAALVEALNPDVIHVQHLLFLSAHLTLARPTLGTLHDGWSICPRAGSLLRGGAEPCEGPPAPEVCAECYAQFATGAAAEHTLGRLAGAASAVVAPERLHRLWQMLPGRARALARVGRPRPARGSEVLRWRAAVASAWRRLDRRVAPSRFYAELAERHGVGPTGHLPHGVPPGPARIGGGPLLFLGSLAPHKGAHLVAEAHRRCPGLPPLRITGPATDAAYAAALPAECVTGPVPNEQVPGLLAGASALVMGSTWPENAPLVVLEARAAGCPVIAPRVGGLPELVEDGVDGALYPPGDIDALAAAMRRVTAAPPPVRPPPTLERHLDGLEQHYRELIQRAPDPSNPRRLR